MLASSLFFSTLALSTVASARPVKKHACPTVDLIISYACPRGYVHRESAGDASYLVCDKEDSELPEAYASSCHYVGNELEMDWSHAGSICPSEPIEISICPVVIETQQA